MIEDLSINCHSGSSGRRISLGSLGLDDFALCSGGLNLGTRLARATIMGEADELQARTDAFADLSIRCVAGLPDAPMVRRLAGQYQDSSTSTAANYRAARRARSHDEFVSKIAIVSEEADESVFWLKRMLNASILSTTVGIETLIAEAEQLARIFGASHRTAKLRKSVRKSQHR